MQFSLQGASPILRENPRTIYTGAQIDSHITWPPPWTSKNVQNLTPASAYKLTLGQDLRLWAAGVTFVQDAWQWQCPVVCTVQATPRHLPGHHDEAGRQVVHGRWLRADATGGKCRSLPVGMSAADSVSSTVAVIDLLCQHFGQHFASTISHRLS